MAKEEVKRAGFWWSPLDPLLADAVRLARLSRDAPEEPKLGIVSIVHARGDVPTQRQFQVNSYKVVSDVCVRACILAASLVPEALANLLLRREDFLKAGKLYDQIDRLPAIAKIGIAVRLRGRTLDAGSPEMQRASALIEMRDGYVHPRPKETWGEGETGVMLPYSENQALRIPNESFRWTHDNAVQVLRSAFAFIDYVLLDCCGMSLEEARHTTLHRVTSGKGETVWFPDDLSEIDKALREFDLNSRVFSGIVFSEG